MEENKESFDDLLWNKYDNIQKRFEENKNYYQILMKYFKEVLIEFDRHTLNLNNIKGDSQIKKFTKLNDIFHLFNLFLNFNLENHKKFITNTITNLEKNIMKQKQLFPAYTDFKQYLELFTVQKKNLNKYKDKFQESASALEKKILKKIKKIKENNSQKTLEISSKLQKEVNDNLKKYQSSIEIINQKREEFVNKQKDLIKLYVKTKEININIYYNILSDFLSLVTDKIISFFNNSKFKKWQKQLQDKDVKKEVINYFDKIKSNENDDEKTAVEFEGYKSKIDLDNCTNNEDYNNCLEAINIIDKNYKYIFDENVLEGQKLKNDIGEWVKTFFELDEKNLHIDEGTFDEYYHKVLKNPCTHKSFLKKLTDLRTNINLNRNKQLIDILNESFKIVLAEAKINKSFNIAKNCLILSQTFYYLDNGNKIYSSESLKKETWLSEKNFWLEFSSYMVEEELKKLNISFPELIFEDIQQNKSFSEKLSSKIDNTIFSQLFTLINNLIYFTNDKSNAIEIIETFKKRYIYLSEKNIQLLYQIISTDESEIKKLLEEKNNNEIIDEPNKSNSNEICSSEIKEDNDKLEDME